MRNTFRSESRTPSQTQNGRPNRAARSVSNSLAGNYMVPQQTGVPPIIRQQVQPAFRHAIMQSQQP